MASRTCSSTKRQYPHAATNFQLAVATVEHLANWEHLATWLWRPRRVRRREPRRTWDGNVSRACGWLATSTYARVGRGWIRCVADGPLDRPAVRLWRRERLWSDPSLQRWVLVCNSETSLCLTEMEQISGMITEKVASQTIIFCKVYVHRSSSELIMW